MILDQETNFVYLADSLSPKYPDFYSSIVRCFERVGIQYALLPKTKDIWVADFMPIQIESNCFLQFKYDPDYLKPQKYQALKTNPEEVTNAIGIATRNSNLRLDGGNVIKGKHWVILTDKIFKENPTIEQSDLLNQLERFFGVKPIIIPQYPGDYIGHADGMVRYYDDETVLINDFESYDKPEFQMKLISALRAEGIKTIPIPYAPYDNKGADEAHGLYINYLELENFVLVPNFSQREDDQTQRLFEQLFPEKLITSIESREISKDGGVLNCITWNIKVL